MQRIVSALAALILAGGIAGQAAAAVDRVPCTIHDDFETGELAAWECYPYAQDIGYEPTTFCQGEPTHNGSKFAAWHVTKPNDMVQLSVGFTKEIGLWTTADTRLKAAVFLTADRKPAALEILLGLSNGDRYLHVVKTPAVNRWLELDIPMAGFAMNGSPLAPGARIQVVAIKATYPVVTHLASYSISLDDFSLNGERQRRFIGVNPSSTDFEMFGQAVFNRHFYFGDTIALSVKPEDAPGKDPLTAVTATVVDSRAKTVASRVKLQLKNGVWTADKLYAIKKTDPRGYWRVKFNGQDAAGTDVRWDIQFIMPGNRIAAGSHPRLHFSAEELKKRLATQSPTEARILESALTDPVFLRLFNADIASLNEGKNFATESLTGNPYSVISSFDNWRSPLTGLARIVGNGSWLYMVKGDEAAGKKAKEALLKMCTFEHWNNPWHDAHGFWTYYPTGYIVGPAAIGYDYLYPLLSEEERATVRRTLMAKAIRPLYRDMTEMNRMPSSNSNHIAVLVSNYSVAATAIYGDDPANPYVEPYLSGILAKTKRYIDRTFYGDGGYGEPMTYQDMATRDLTEMFDVLERNFGIDFVLDTHVQDSWLYPLYVTDSNGRYPDFGDVAHVFDLNGVSFQYFTHKLKNPYLYSFTKPAFDSGRGSIQTWLRYTTGITPKSREEFVPSRMFPEKGNMVMRSGWSDDGSVLAFKAGPNSNHYHYDQGTFQIMTNGEDLLSDAGHGSDYYANLYYPCYYIQPVGHNVMLIDGDPESQVPADYENCVTALRDYPHMLHSFGSRTVDEAAGDLTCVYKGNVKNYTRSILFVKPGMLFLYDSVKGASAHTYSWLFHAEHTDGKSSITSGKNSVDIVRTKSNLHMDILSPAIVSNRVRNSDRDESFVTLTGAPGTTDTDFLAVLFPRPSKDAPAVAPVSTLIGGNGWTGAKVNEPGGITVACFRTSGGPGAGTVEGFSSDADRFAVTTDPAGKASVVFVRGSSLVKDGAPLFRSSEMVSSVVSFNASGTLLETDSNTGAAITFPIGAAPVSVTLDGKAASGWKYDAAAKTFTVTVPIGHSEVKIR